MSYPNENRYRIELARPIKLGHAWLRPQQKCVVDGKTLNQLLADPANSGAINVTGEAA